MFINKAKDGKNNLCGVTIAQLRKSRNMSQRMLAEQMQLIGLDIDKNAIQRIESGQRFVTDIELMLFSEWFGISSERLLHEPPDAQPSLYPSCRPVSQGTVFRSRHKPNQSI